MVYAIDVQKDLLRRIKNEAHARGLHNIEIIWGDLEIPGSSKIHPHTVDVVLFSNVLFQMPVKRTPLEEAKRIVKKSGRIVIIDWIDSFGGLGPHKDDVLTKAGAKALASHAGLRLVEEFGAGAHHYGLIFSPQEVQ
jgi:ubiquinone/menaquinone biosynthesis C-methylase UbiE